MIRIMQLANNKAVANPFHHRFHAKITVSQPSLPLMKFRHIPAETAILTKFSAVVDYP